MAKIKTKKWRENISRAKKAQKLKTSNAAKEKIKLIKQGKYIGKNNWNWKGENAGYNTIHTWVRRWKGKPDYCQLCGTIKKRYTWANIDHKYRRNLDDYISLCYSCHRYYDKKLI